MKLLWLKLLKIGEFFIDFILGSVRLLYEKYKTDSFFRSMSCDFSFSFSTKISHEAQHGLISQVLKDILFNRSSGGMDLPPQL